jgi:N-acylneuraminate cytidylyltransferase
MRILYIIPARGGSKGIPRKNIKPLNGKPLIYYSIDVARELTIDEDICVSTEDDEIIQVVKDYGLQVPFKRPQLLATDEASTHEVLIHAINHYESTGKKYDAIVLLQPTSPLRTAEEVQKAIKLFNHKLEMVVSVRESHAAALICRENEDGFIELILAKNSARRQDLKNYYEYNGAIFIINIKSLKKKNIMEFKKIKKIVMNELHSIDLDTPFDWKYAEFIISNSKENV